MLREQRPDLRIGFFLHIPFPPVELFMQLPWRTEIVRGLLGADVVGFQMPGGAQNFLWLARRLLGLEPSKAAVRVRSRPGSVPVDGRQVRVGAFPISIDAAAFDAAVPAGPGSPSAPSEMRSEMGNPPRLLLGVDRLDYTKGIDVRLRALRELLDAGRVDPESVAMVQLATPEPRAGRPVQGDAAQHRGAGRDGSTASSAGSAARSSTTCTSRWTGKSWSRCTARPTSWWSRRCATA